MRSISRGIVGLLSGGAQPRDVAGAVVVGLLAGALFGFNFTLVALLLVALLLNLHGKTLLASLAAGAAGGCLLEVEIYQLGRWLLERPTARGAINALGDGPLATLLGVNDYRMVGALTAATAIGLPAAWWAAWLIRGERTRLAAAAGTAGWRFSTWFARILIGADARHRQQVMTAPPRTFRPAGGFIAVAVAPIALTLVWCITAETAVETLLANLSSGNRAPVRAGAIDISLWTGKLAIDDLRFADPANEGRDRLRIRRVTGFVNPAALLCGRIEADQLLVAGLRTDVRRRGAARSDSMTAFRLKDATRWEDPALAASSARVHAPLALHENIRGFQQVANRLGGVAELIAQLRQMADHEQSTAATIDSPRGRRRCQPRRGQPEMTATALQIEDLPRAWNLGPKAAIEIANLNSNPLASGRPTTVRAVVPQLAAEMSMQLNLHEPGQPHDVAVQAYRLPLARLVAVDRYGPEVKINGGTVDIAGEGWADERQLQVPLRIDAQQIEVRAEGLQPIAGLPPELWNEGIGRLGRLRVEAQLVGAWSRPRIEIDEASLVRSLRQQLHAAGSDRLVAAIDEAILNPQALGGKTQLAVADTTTDRVGSPTLDPTVSAAEQPAQTVEQYARRTAPRVQPGVYPSTANPTGWVPEPPAVVNTSAETNVAFAESLPAETRRPTEPSASVAIVVPQTEDVPAPAVATAQPTATAVEIDPPAPVDLTLGYDSAPFDTIDRRLTQSVELLETAESVERQLAGDVVSEAETPTSALAGWTQRARSAVARAWPFAQSREPGKEELADEIVPEYYPDELEPWQTVDPPMEPVSTVAGRPWYERIWR